MIWKQDSQDRPVMKRVYLNIRLYSTQNIVILGLIRWDTQILGHIKNEIIYTMRTLIIILNRDDNQTCGLLLCEADDVEKTSGVLRAVDAVTARIDCTRGSALSVRRAVSRPGVSRGSMACPFHSSVLGQWLPMALGAWNRLALGPIPVFPAIESTPQGKL